MVIPGGGKRRQVFLLFFDVALSSAYGDSCSRRTEGGRRQRSEKGVVMTDLVAYKLRALLESLFREGGSRL